MIVKLIRSIFRFNWNNFWEFQNISWKRCWNEFVFSKLSGCRLCTSKALKKDFNTGIFQWVFGKIFGTEKCGQFSYNFMKVALCCILFQETFVYIDIVYLLESAATKKCKLWAADTWLVPTGTFKSLIIQKISRKVFAVDFSVVKQVLVIQL